MRNSKLVLRVLTVAVLAATPAYAGTILFPSDTGYLQEAIDTVAPGDTVLVESGRWIVRNIDLRSGITIGSQAGDSSMAALDGHSNGGIFRADDVTDVVIYGLTLKNATASWYNRSALSCVSSEIALHDVVFISNEGSAMACWSTEATLHDVVFTGNDTRGMSAEESDLVLEGVVFRDNGITGSGAGLYCSASNVAMTGCVFESNEVGVLVYTQTTWSYRGSGGGACVTDGSTLAASDVTFDSNHTWYEGAGLCLRGEGTFAELTGCVFTNNTTSTDVGYMGAEQRGAALSVTGGAEVVLDDVKFTRNWSHEDGGAISCTGGAMATISDCAFTECEAGSDGGAILAYGSADVTATSCLFRRNLAGGCGGALYQYSWGDEVPIDVSYCIFNGNSADGGGAVFAFRGHVGLAHCTLVENEAGTGSSVRAHPWGTATVANCILSYGAGGDVVSGDVEVTHCCVLEPEPGSGLCGESYENMCTDPLFCPSRVQDFTLCSDSPCLPSNNDWGELVGAAGAGCGPCNTPVLETSWGSIKAMFRGD